MFATPQDFGSSVTPANPPSDPTPKPLYDMIIVQKAPKIVNSTIKSTVNSAKLDKKPTYEVAIRGPDRDQWIKAMNDEIMSIK